MNFSPKALYPELRPSLFDLFMIVTLLREVPVLNKIIYGLGVIRAGGLYEKINKLLNKKDEILDIGAGPCNLIEILRNKGYTVTGIDVQNISFVKGINPIIFDGKIIPFPDDSFDVSLLLTVLHHVKNPRKLILEAKRVSRRIVIIEDTYGNLLEKFLTYFFDSLINLEFAGHPHSNKSDAEWKKEFERLGLKLLFSEEYRFLGFRNATYLLEK